MRWYKRVSGPSAGSGHGWGLYRLLDGRLSGADRGRGRRRVAAGMETAQTPPRHGRRRPTIHDLFFVSGAAKTRGWSAFADHDGEERPAGTRMRPGAARNACQPRSCQVIDISSTRIAARRCDVVRRPVPPRHFDRSAKRGAEKSSCAGVSAAKRADFSAPPTLRAGSGRNDAGAETTPKLNRTAMDLFRASTSLRRLACPRSSHDAARRGCPEQVRA